MSKKRSPHTYGLYQNQAAKLAEVMALYEAAFSHEEEAFMDTAHEIVIETLQADRSGFDVDAFEGKISRELRKLRRLKGLKEEE